MKERPDLRLWLIVAICLCVLVALAAVVMFARRREWERRLGLEIPAHDLSEVVAKLHIHRYSLALEGLNLIPGEPNGNGSGKPVSRGLLWSTSATLSHASVIGNLHAVLHKHTGVGRWAQGNLLAIISFLLAFNLPAAYIDSVMTMSENETPTGGSRSHMRCSGKYKSHRSTVVDGQAVCKRCAVPLTKYMRNRTERQRFMDMVRIEPNGCHIWTGSIMRDGYGKLCVFGKMWLAHRYAWAVLAKRELPDYETTGLTLDHICERRPCTNVDHLRIMKATENTIRGVFRPICKRGHDQTKPENRYYFNVKGRRRVRCKPCIPIQTAAFWARRKAQSH